MDSDFMNVLEGWSLYDTLCVCPSLYGTEANVGGWFTSVPNFAARDSHLFFKTRNAANVGRAYTNMDAADRVPFAFHAYTIGVKFFGPSSPVLYGNPSGTTFGGHVQETLPHFWQTELPRHCSVTLKVGQDIQWESSAMHLPPGYGAVISGSSFSLDLASSLVDGTVLGPPQHVFMANQGVPDRFNRQSLVASFKTPDEGLLERELVIPRDETIEVKVELSEYAQDFLKSCGGPYYYAIPTDSGEASYTLTGFRARFGIQITIHGVREVQQRGQLHFY